MKINQRVMSFKNLRHQCFICLFFEIHLESLDSSKCHRDDVNMTSRVGVGGAQCNNSVGDSVVLARLIVSCKCQCIGDCHDIPLHADDQRS